MLRRARINERLEFLRQGGRIRGQARQAFPADHAVGGSEAAAPHLRQQPLLAGMVEATEGEQQVEEDDLEPGAGVPREAAVMRRCQTWLPLSWSGLGRPWDQAWSVPGDAMSGFDLIVRRDEEDIEAAEVFVDGRVGARNYRFLLDTGAGRTCVAFDDYTATFDVVGSPGSSGVFARRRSDDLVMAPSIEIGPISKSNVTVVRRAETSAGRSNLIGMDMLEDHCCHFLFDEHRVVVDPADDAGNHYAFHDLLYDEKFHPYIDVRFGTRTARAVWDTGAGITVVGLGFIDDHPEFFREAGRSSGTDATGHGMETPMFRMASPVIGGQAFPPHMAAGVDLSPVNATITLPMDLIVGYSTLGKANWLFDFPHRRWAVTRLPSEE